MRMFLNKFLNNRKQFLVCVKVKVYNPNRVGCKFCASVVKPSVGMLRVSAEFIARDEQYWYGVSSVVVEKIK